MNRAQTAIHIFCDLRPRLAQHISAVQEALPLGIVDFADKCADFQFHINKTVNLGIQFLFLFHNTLHPFGVGRFLRCAMADTFVQAAAVDALGKLSSSILKLINWSSFKARPK